LSNVGRLQSEPRFYDKLSVGGYAIIDDCAENARPAVEAPSMIFRRQRDIKEPRLKLLLLETRPLKHDHANQPHRDASV
jgi:hypothetical protein